MNNNSPKSTTQRRQFGVVLLGSALKYSGLLLLAFVVLTPLWDNTLGIRFVYYLYREDYHGIPPYFWQFFILSLIILSLGVGILRRHKWAYVVLLTSSCIFTVGCLNGLIREGSQIHVALCAMLCIIGIFAAVSSIYLSFRHVRTGFAVSTKTLWTCVFVSCFLVGAGMVHQSHEPQRLSRQASQALERLDQIKKYAGGTNSSMKIFEMALRQPEFEGILEAEGGLITFDENGNPINGSTISEINPKTGAPTGLRTLSDSEIRLNQAQLIQYYDALRKTGWSAKQIIVYSRCLRKAACAYALNDDPNVDFMVRRQGRSLQVLQRDALGTRLIASDTMYSFENGNHGE